MEDEQNNDWDFRGNLHCYFSLAHEGAYEANISLSPSHFALVQVAEWPQGAGTGSFSCQIQVKGTLHDCSECDPGVHSVYRIRLDIVQSSFLKCIRSFVLQPLPTIVD